MSLRFTNTNESHAKPSQPNALALGYVSCVGMTFNRVPMSLRLTHTNQDAIQLEPCVSAVWQRRRVFRRASATG